MLELSSWVARLSMVLAAMVGLAAAAILASMAIPQMGREDACELNSPYLVGGAAVPGERIEVAVAPARCDLGMSEGQTISLQLVVRESPVFQDDTSQKNMAPDGSLHASLPLDPRNTTGRATLKVMGSVPGCDEDEHACAAWVHEFATTIDAAP